MATPPDQRRAPHGRPQQPLRPLRPLLPRPPASPVLQQRALAALLMVLTGLLGMVLLSGNLRRAVVVLAVTLVIGGTGLWIAITAMTRSTRAGTARPRFSVLATVLGVIVTGLSAMALVGFALFWTQFSQYTNCTAGANTVTARSACDQQLNNSLNTNLRLFGAR